MDKSYFNFKQNQEILTEIKKKKNTSVTMLAISMRQSHELPQD